MSFQQRLILPAALAASCLAPGAAWSQHSPYLPDERYRLLAEELSGDRALDSIRHLTVFHRTPASPDFFAAAEWIRAAAESAGLEDVRLIRQDWDEPGWRCVSGEAWIVAPERNRLADCGAVAVSFADNSRSAHVEAELVDVGAGTAESDYADVEVEGRIVLASGPVGTVHAQAVWKRGAAGVVSYTTHRHEAFDAPDQVAWGQLPHSAQGVDGVDDGAAPGFAVMISPRRGQALRAQVVAGGVRIRVDLETETTDDGQALVEGWIRGDGTPGQQIVLTAHLQEEKTSANDDGSGCASLLEIGRTLSRLVREGALPRPRRDIRFWWLNEIRSQERYFQDHPEAASQMLVNVNQDMVGARQSWGGRVQYASRLPWSRPFALEDVMESVLGAVRDGNTELLTMRGTSLRLPYTREVTAVTGSREPFHARMLPYFDFTDHHVFNRADVGVPGTSLTNWPDDWIHSTGDDLPNVDATQLERNALVVAGVAWYFASLEDAELPALVTRIASNGLARSAGDTARAVGLVAGAAADARATALRDARALVRESHAREIRGLEALRGLGDGGILEPVLGPALASVLRSAAQAREQVDAAWTAVGGAEAEQPQADEAERELAGHVWSPVADRAARAAAWQDLKPVPGLHAMMQFETLNFADGTRTGLGVFEAVRSEALAAGDWYYGTVTADAVKAVLDSAVAAGAFEVREAP